MSNRDSLHSLVDSLPEAAFGSIERVLRTHQTWPPLPPQPQADVEEMWKRVKERFEKSAREYAAATGRGVVGGFFRGGHFRPGGGGDGAASMTGCEGETLVKVELRFFRSHKLELEERLRLSADKRFLLYSQKITGPTGVEDFYEKEFAVGEVG
jgi:hypothetical protein